MKTTDHPLGTILRDGDRVGLRYERRFAHPPEKVWRALTESDHLAHWMPCDLIGERREGAAIELRMWPAEVAKHEIEEPSLFGTIRVWDPPHVFEWTWDVDLLRWELEPTDEGTRLTFTTWLGESDYEVAQTAAGYHFCLDALVSLLDTGSATPLVDLDTAAMEARYRDLL
jgi:uncharacterized protein YndB with AHSA1/START domain